MQLYQKEVQICRRASDLHSISKALEVTNIWKSKDKKWISLSDGSSFPLLLSASVGIHDKVILRGNEIYVKCVNGLAALTPIYEERDYFVVGDTQYAVEVKEIESDEEIEGQKYLSSFHYRDDSTYGRKVRLAIVSGAERPDKVLGYIELGIAPLMNKARNRILDFPYNDGYLSWDAWDFTTKGRYSSAIVSISRIVTHPQYRGLGLSRMLLNHAFNYSKTHWQVKGAKPIFVEIVADMLKFLPFVKNTGLLYIGNTEGNASRVKKDLQYYNKYRARCLKHHETNSIIRMQSHYLKKLIDMCESGGLAIEEIFELIEAKERGVVNEKITSLNGILRLPKPTYLFGLNSYAKEFLERRISALRIKEPNNDLNLNVDALDSPIIFNSVSLSFDSTIKLCERTHQIKEAFGLSDKALSTKVLDTSSFSIKPKETILVTGASGTGKTCLLRLIKGDLKPSNGDIYFPRNIKIGELKPISNKKPLIANVGDSLEEAIFILNKSGLSEANLYLKTYADLSDGQKYRAMIAKLINERCNIWIADEFLNSLDYITANIVARNIRTLAKNLGITLIVASSNPGVFIDAFKPDKILIKSFGSKLQITNQELA